MMRWRNGPLLISLTAIPACASPYLPERVADLVGVVVRAGPELTSAAGPNEYQIHVKVDPEEECGDVFTVDSNTTVVDARGTQRVADRSILTIGATVAVWFEVVGLSCPGKGRAEAVERRE